jgi:hypothetical protein
LEKEKLTENDLLVYGAYNQVAVSLQHSNRIQLTYKTITSTWILATFIGIGYSISSVEVNLPLHPLLIVCILALASFFVIMLIWYLDLIVQEKNIASAVHIGLQLEDRYTWLPQAYHNVVELSHLFGYVAMKSIFYLGCASLLLLTICSSLTFYLFLLSSTLWLLVPIATAIVIPALFLICQKLTKKTDPYPILKKIHK